MNTREAVAKVSALLGITPRTFWILLATHALAVIAGALLF